MTGQSQINLDVSAFSKGTYFLRITAEQGQSVVRKLIVE